MPTHEREPEKQEKEQEENAGEDVIPIPIPHAVIFIIDHTCRPSSKMPHDPETSQAGTEQQLAIGWGQLSESPDEYEQ
jgi:hypothetical protein